MHVPAGNQEYPGRIRQLRKQLKLRQIPFAKLLKVDQAAVSKWESGRHQPTPDKFVDLAKLAAEPERAWFLGQAGVTRADIQEAAKIEAQTSAVSLDEIEINVYRSAGAGSFRFVDEIADEVVKFPRTWLPTTQRLVGLLVRGDSMWPLVPSGSVVIVDRARKTAAQALNHIVAAREDDGVAIRWLERSGGDYWLVPQNPDHRPVRLLPTTRILGVVIKWIAEPPSARK